MASEPGSVTISRNSPGEGEEYVTVTIRTGDQDVRAEMTLTDFALAVTGRGRTPATIRVRPLATSDTERAPHAEPNGPDTAGHPSTTVSYPTID